MNARLEPYLRPGEQLRWSGRPGSSLVCTPADIIAVPLGVIALAIALGARAINQAKAQHG